MKRITHFHFPSIKLTVASIEQPGFASKRDHERVAMTVSFHALGAGTVRTSQYPHDAVRCTHVIHGTFIVSFPGSSRTFVPGSSRKREGQRLNMGIIGSGEIVGTLALRFRAVGHDVSVTNPRGTALAEDAGAHAVSLRRAAHEDGAVVVVREALAEAEPERTSERRATPNGPAAFHRAA